MPNAKICPRCKELKPLDLFSKKSNSDDERQAYCTVCNKEQKARWYKRNRESQLVAIRERKRGLRAFVSELKKLPCTDCGNSFHPVAMDFDHTSNDKVRTVSDLVKLGVSKENLLKEIAKCDLVCSNCHRVRTWERNQAALV